VFTVSGIVRITDTPTLAEQSRAAQTNKEGASPGLDILLHGHRRVAAASLMPQCDLPDGLGQRVDDDCGSAVAETVDGGVVGLVGSSVEFQRAMTMRLSCWT
jgi:hypothetical protein